MIKYSIIITAYNYEKFIKECIDTCLNQSKEISFEVIVVNDGSTDSTCDILDQYDHELLSCYTIQNSGIEKASNYGFKKAKGEYLIRVDADDLLHKDFLYEMNRVVENEDASFYYSNYYIIDNESVITSTTELPSFNEKEIMERGDFLATGSVYQKSVLEKVGFYNEDVKNSGLENYHLIVDLLSLGLKGKHVKSNLFFYRRHSLNLSELRREKIIQYGIDLFKQKKLGIFKTNENHPYKLKLN